MPEMTAIRVRGKRGATKAEKWHAGKKRRDIRAVSPAASLGSSAAASTGSVSGTALASRKRKKHNPELSRLEQLPTEILQDIFDLSANLNLPFVSKALLSQVCSHHVYIRLTSRILASVLHLPGDGKANSADLAAAQRLLNTRFMTWDFFRSWVSEQAETGLADHCDSDDVDLNAVCKQWAALRPPLALLPPRSALRGPFSGALRQDRLNFLHVFAHFEPNIPSLDPVHAELAYEGFSAAIDANEADAVRWFLAFGLRPNTELFRQAIIDKGCDVHIVGQLLRRASALYAMELGQAREQSEHVRHVEVGVDYLDPALWSWAEKHRITMTSDPDRSIGDWLLRHLKYHSARVAELADTAV